MPALLETPTRPLSMNDVATISAQLADDLSNLTWKSEGFSVDDYLTLGGNYLVEFDAGRIQVLPMPTPLHQRLTKAVVRSVDAWAVANDPGAECLFAPLFVRLNDALYREPDVCYMSSRHADRKHATFWDGADLVVEILSESNRSHDLRTKRREYAAAGIPEYWIVDSEDRTVAILTLRGAHYVEHGVFGAGERATSVLLPGLMLDVGAMFDEAMRTTR